MELGGLAKRLRLLGQEFSQVQGEATADSVRRFSLLPWVAIPLHIGLLAWFAAFEAPAGRPELQAWADALVIAQVAMLLAVVLVRWGARWLLDRGQEGSPWGLVLQVTFSLCYLTFGAFASILDVRVGNGIATFMLICIATSVVSLMGPWWSLGVFGVAFGVFELALLALQVDKTLMASFQLQAISAVCMAQGISVIVMYQYSRTVLLRRQLTRTNEALVAKQQELQFLAERDTLTGLYNRRQFMKLAQAELMNPALAPPQISMVMVDLDHFKAINDTYGHPVGDEVLQRVAKQLTEGTRTSDVVARVGGEEFVVLLGGTDAASARVVAQKLCATLHAHPLQLQHMELAVTASFGVTSVALGRGADLSALYASADRALYAAKHQGRNRVEYLECLPA